MHAFLISNVFVVITRKFNLSFHHFSLRYHNFNPEYIHDRLKHLGNSFELRILLVLVDVVRYDLYFAQCLSISAFGFLI